MNLYTIPRLPGNGVKSHYRIISILEDMPLEKLHVMDYNAVAIKLEKAQSTFKYSSTVKFSWFSL